MDSGSNGRGFKSRQALWESLVNEENNGENKKKKDIYYVAISIITFILGVIVGLLLSRCPGREKKSESLKETFPEKSTSAIKEREVRVFVEGKPVGEIFPSYITLYKAEVTTFQAPPTCQIPKFSPSIIEAPGKYTNKRAVDIVFSPGLVFTCKTEGFEFPCGVNSNRIKVEYLDDGLKTFEIKYKDEMGCEADLIKITFLIDTVPPITKIIPDGFSELVTSPDARFRFEVNEPYRITLCKVDDGFWIDCSAGAMNLSSLEEGWHKISAYSVDIVGNEEEQVKEYEFKVDARPPVSFLKSAPPPVTNSQDAIFEFDADEDDVRFECRLGDGEWFPCTSPQKFSGMNPGIHKFRLKAIDNLGRIEDNPLIYSWTVVEGDLKGNLRPFVPPRELTKIRKYKKALTIQRQEEQQGEQQEKQQQEIKK